MAAKELVPIKVLLFRKTDGSGADWPNFNLVDSGIRKGMDWSRYVDVHGIKWHYNKVENLGTGADNGEACSCVPKDFADAAVAMFPDKVSKLTEAEFENFYDNKAHAHEPDEDIDYDLIKAINLKQGMGLALTAQQQAALDPMNDVPGIRKNKQRKWQDFKTWYGGGNIKIVQ